MLNFSVLVLNILLFFIGFEPTQTHVKAVKFTDLYLTDYINPEIKRNEWKTILMGKQDVFLTEYTNYVNKSKTTILIVFSILNNDKVISSEGNDEIKVKYNIVYNNKRFIKTITYTIGSTQKTITDKFDFDGTKMAFTYTVEPIY